MDNNLGFVLLWLVAAVIGLVVQYNIIASAVGRAMREHSIWSHSQLPTIIEQMNDGRRDDRGHATGKK